MAVEDLPAVLDELLGLLGASAHDCPARATACHWFTQLQSVPSGIGIAIPNPCAASHPMRAKTTFGRIGSVHARRRLNSELTPLRRRHQVLVIEPANMLSAMVLDSPLDN